MATMSAPRIDDRLRAFITIGCRERNVAELNRSVGALAVELGLPRPSYQQVRVLRAEARDTAAASVESSWLNDVDKALAFLSEYPGPGLADWYARYKRGEL